VRAAPPRRRVKPGAVVIQLLALATVLALIGWFVHNAGTNLRERGIASGFGFIEEQAGFAISEGIYPYEIGDSYLHAFAAGVANTLRAALPAALLATMLGFGLGVAQISRHALLARLARGIVDVVRNIPLLVQVLLWYLLLNESLPAFDAPWQWQGVAALGKSGLHLLAPVDLAGWGWLAAAGLAGVATWFAARLLPGARGGRTLLLLGVTLAVTLAGATLAPVQWQGPQLGDFGISGGATLSTEWLAIVGALSLFASAYCAEIVRAGLQAVPRGQWEAAHALALTPRQALRYVVLPQGLRVMLPPYTSLLMNTLKNSSLAVAIGYPDIVSVASTSLNQTGQAIECISVIAAVYLSLNLITATVMSWVNARVQIRER
jgi:general L-amino acid transport system permease protein